MKQIFVFITVMILGVVTSFAQHGKGGKNKSPQEKTAHQMKKMTERLSLSEEQVVKLTPITLTNNEKIATLNVTKTEANKKQVNKEIKAVKMAWETEFKKELNPDQIVEFDKMIAEKKAKRKAKRGNKKEK